MKNIKTFTKTLVTIFLLFATISFTGCSQKEVELLKKENAILRDRVYYMEAQIEYLNKADSSFRVDFLKLCQQEKETLNLIAAHLKYNHGF